MRNLVKQLSYEPRIVLQLVVFFFAFIFTIVPLLGPACLGLIIFRVVKMGEIRKLVDVYVPIVLGIIVHGLAFYLSSWPFDAFIVVTFLNLVCFAGGCIWARFVS